MSSNALRERGQAVAATLAPLLQASHDGVEQLHPRGTSKAASVLGRARRRCQLRRSLALSAKILYVGLFLQAGYAVGQVPADILISPQFTIAAGVTPADSNTGNPGRPAIGFDGTNYLVVSCREIGAPGGLFGTLVSKEQEILATFHIADINPIYGCQGRGPSVSFDGVNYLVVFSQVAPTGSLNILGTRVSTSGTVLDAPDGFGIFSDVADAAAVAFDGANYLVVSAKYSNDTLHDIVGARVSTTGQVLEEFPVFTAPGGQVMASVAFDGVNYLVVWSDTRSGSPVGPDADIVGTRVTPAGAVLDPAGTAISTAAGAQSTPRIIFDGTNYFAVWEDARNNVSGSFPARVDIFGTRVRPDGTLLDGPSDTGGIAINTAALPKQHPVAAFDGENYLVAWEVSFFYDPPVGIFGARVSPAGALVDGPADAPGIPIGAPSCFACRFVSPNVASGADGLLLAWVNNSEVSGTGKDIVGVGISTPAPAFFPFAKLDPKLFLVRGGKGTFLAEGSFSLAQASDGIDPVAEPVVVSLADEDGVFFTQTIPAGGFRRTKDASFVFAAAKQGPGILWMGITPGGTPRSYRFAALASRIDLKGADHRSAAITLELGNDSGSQKTRCHAIATLLVCR